MIYKYSVAAFSVTSLLGINGCRGMTTTDANPLVVTSPLIWEKADKNLIRSVTGWTIPLNVGGTEITIQVDTGSEDFVVVSTLCTSEQCLGYNQYDTEGGRDLDKQGQINYGSGAETWDYELYEDWVVVIGDTNPNLTSIVLGAVTDLTEASLSGDGILGVGPEYSTTESTIKIVKPDAKTFIQTLMDDGQITVPAFTIHFGQVLGENDIDVLERNNDAINGTVEWGSFALTEGMVVVETVCNQYQLPLVAFDVCYRVDDDNCGRKVSIPVPPQADSASEHGSPECKLTTPIIDSGTSELVLPQSMYDPLLSELADMYGSLFGLTPTELQDLLAKNKDDTTSSNFIAVELFNALTGNATDVTFEDIIAASPAIVMTFENEATLVASAGDLVQFGFSLAQDGLPFLIGDTVLFGDSVSYHTTEKKMAFKGQEF